MRELYLVIQQVAHNLARHLLRVVEFRKLKPGMSLMIFLYSLSLLLLGLCGEELVNAPEGSHLHTLQHLGQSGA